MASLDELLEDPEYTNWVKSGLALNITNEVLRPFVVEEIKKLHQSIVKTLPRGVSCGGCSVNTRCPNSICDNIQREIENKHWYSYPSFRNTCTGRWGTEPWEIAKCYMSPSKGCKRSSASDADFSACISVIINCKHFQAFGTSDPNTTETVYSESRDFRNTVMHGRFQKVCEQCTKENLDILITILNKVQTPKTKEAIAKIQKIKTNQLNIKLEDVIEVRKNAIEAIADKGEKQSEQVQRERLLVNFEAGCRKALCRLTEEHISKQKRNLSVAAFLSKVEIFYEVKNLCSRHQEMLFPENGSHADIREWDLFVYCFILEKLNVSEPIGNDVSLFVQEVKQIRDKILLDATTVTQNDLSDLCKYLIDTGLNTETTKIFNKDSPDVDVIRSNNILVSWWREEEEFGNKQVSKEQLNNSKQIVEEVVKKRMTECRDMILQEVREMLGDRGEHLKLKVGAAEIGAKSELKVIKCDKKTEEEIQEHITNPNNNGPEKTKALNNLCQKLNLKDAKIKEGSIILVVTCSSITNVLDFWDSCIDGRVVEALSDLRDYYRRYFDCDTLEFDVILTKKGVSRCVNEIVKGVSSYFERLIVEVTDEVREILGVKEILSSNLSKRIAIRTEEERTKEEKQIKEKTQLKEIDFRERIMEGKQIKVDMSAMATEESGVFMSGETEDRDDPDALKFGEENVRHIRLMVVGMLGVGKTTIIRRMFKGVTVDDSTKWIDISVNACEVGDSGEWRVTDIRKKKEDVDYENRIMDFIREKRVEKQVEKQPRAKKDQKQTTTDFKKLQNRKVDVTYRQTGPLEEDTHLRPKEGEVFDERHEETPLPEPKADERISKTLKKDQHKKFAEFLKDAMVVNKHAKPEKRVTTVSIWDFAGQSIYYSTHHFFLSSRAIYLLVLDISKKLEDPVPEDKLCAGDSENRATSMPKGFTCLDAFKFWMNSIYTYTSSMKDSSNAYRPSIVLVGTFKDKLLDVTDKERYKEKYFNEALTSIQNSDVLHLVHNKKFFVSKDDQDEIFDALKFELTNIAKKQVFWNEPVPIKWMPLERAIELWKGNPFQTETDSSDEDNAILELEKLENIDKETEYPLGDKKQLKVFLKFQHALGNVLYYDADGLDNKIILEPQWILDVFKLFVAHARDTPPSLTQMLDNYEQNAILGDKLIAELINQNPKFRNNQEDAIKRYMEYLDVIAKPVQYTEQENRISSGDRCSKPSDKKKEDFYIVPCLLSQLPPKDILEPGLDDKSTPVLCLVFKNDFLPAFVCHRLMATCIRLWEIREYKPKEKPEANKRMVFNGMGVFWRSPAKTSWLKLWWKDHIIYMQIFLRSLDKEKQLDGKDCMEVRMEIERLIRRIFSIQRNPIAYVGMNETDQYGKYIKCPDCKNDPIDDTRCMISVETIMGQAEAACGYGHLMSRDKALSKWFFNEINKQKLQDLFAFRGALLRWMENNTDESVKMKTEDFAELSSCIGKEYVALGIALGLSFTCIEHIQDQERDVKTRIKNMLEKWSKTATDRTVGVMKRAIMKVLGIHYEDGKFLKESFDRKTVVAWFNSKMTLGNQMTTSSDGQPCPDAQSNADVEPLSEQDLLKVTHFVSGKYKELAKCLFKEGIYPQIEQYEEAYSLDDMRVLAVLLYWRKTDQDASIVHLREALKTLYGVQEEELRNESPYDSTVEELQPNGRFEYIRGRADSDEKRPEETVYKRHGGVSAERGLSGEGGFSEAEFKNEEEPEQDME